ncbi:MAG: hypothetical protein ACTSRU_01400 [Candidatus Hodarchaeales archaeon]
MEDCLICHNEPRIKEMTKVTIRVAKLPYNGDAIVKEERVIYLCSKCRQTTRVVINLGDLTMKASKRRAD